MSEANGSGILNLGFLTIYHEGSGYVGGYLITNSWGRPVEFRLSTAVQPNRVQQILYGATLSEYVSVDLIGKTLLEKSASTIHLLFTDSLGTLAIRKRIEVPVLAVIPPSEPPTPFVVDSPFEQLSDPRCSVPMMFDPRHDKAEDLRALLERLDTTMDVREPFGRIREAMGEARKMGVSNRAA